MSIYLPRKARVVYFPKCFLLHCGYPCFCAEEDDQVEQNTKVMEEDPVVYDLDNDMDDVMAPRYNRISILVILLKRIPNWMRQWSRSGLNAATLAIEGCRCREDILTLGRPIRPCVQRY